MLHVSSSTCSWPYPASDFEYESPQLSRSRPDLKIRYSFVKPTYHEYAATAGQKKKNKFVRPDCVAALNCGFIFYQSWDPSIPPMLK